MYFAYLLKCVDGSLYAGWTDDIEKRLRAHNAGRGSKYTRSRLPVALWHCEAFETRSEAMRRECALKSLSHKQKLALKQDPPENGRHDTCGGERAENDDADL